MSGEDFDKKIWQENASRADYRAKLKEFDAIVCDAIAVSQASAQRLEMPAIGYSTHVFTRICSHSRAMVCALPHSRWIRKDFETWDILSIAAHARSILEGYVLFRYLSDAPDDMDVQRAYVNVMHLYDCLKRIKILSNIISESEVKELINQASGIRERLNNIDYFSKVDQKRKKDILSGKLMTIIPKSEIITSIGLNQSQFDFFWNYLSQYTHVLSFTFYRIEENGRGTGMENEFDRGVLIMTMAFCTMILSDAVDKMVDMFPESLAVRRGIDSKFSPGPSRNLPKYKKRGLR